AAVGREADDAPCSDEIDLCGAADRHGKVVIRIQPLPAPVQAAVVGAHDGSVLADGVDVVLAVAPDASQINQRVGPRLESTAAVGGTKEATAGGNVDILAVAAPHTGTRAGETPHDRPGRAAIGRVANEPAGIRYGVDIRVAAASDAGVSGHGRALVEEARA